MEVVNLHETGHESGASCTVDVGKDILEANREIAEQNRKIFAEHGIRAFDVMGSIGSGKTTLISRIVDMVGGEKRVSVIACDLTTSIDSNRIKASGATVVQINTGKECYVDASQVNRALKKINLESVDMLFIENVGNLICPVDFPLGTEARIVVISTTEGPYTVVKHPYIFQASQVAVINKKDLAKVMGVSLDQLRRDIQRINPAIDVVETNALTGEGVTRLLGALGIDREQRGGVW